MEQVMRRSRRLPALIIGLALLVLAGAILIAALQARARIREQIAGRDGEVLEAVALLYHAEDVEEGLAEPTLDQGEQLSIVLKSSQLRGVLGVRLYSPEGDFISSFPAYVIESELPNADLPALATLRAISRFYPQAQMAGLFYPVAEAPTNTIPVLEVNVPLHSEKGPLAGIAQFLIEGQSIAAECARLDRLLAAQALMVFGVGGTGLALVLTWAFRRLRRAQKLLSDRTENLVRANQELALAAKSSALGTVAAHLIHGLKNPLAGLQNFVSSRGSGIETDEDSDWQQAIASTSRMQSMINQVVGVLREEETGTSYEVTLLELEHLVRNRVQPLARELGVNFATAIQTEATLPNRAANLVALILINLVENAAQATPPGKSVALAAVRVGDDLVFEVRDEGPGFPADTPLFMPCRSTKAGGTGIGLALGKQLANHLGAELELANSTAAGCVFTLKLPVTKAAVLARH
jgi:signal transduction histidine kinase